MEAQPTGFTVVLVRNDGERLFLAHLGHQSLYSLDTDRTQLLNLIDPGDFVHVSGYFMLPRVRTELPSFLKEAHNRKARISFDPGWDSNGFNEASRTELFQLLPNADFFEPNETELKAISRKPTIQESIAQLTTHYSGIIALKMGEFGSRIYDHGQIIAEAKSFSTQVIDSTGAGDAFDAGFIHGIINQQNYAEAARIGNATASVLISRRGAGQSRFPTVADIEKLMTRSTNH